MQCVVFLFGFKTDGEQPFSQLQSLDQDRPWRKRQFDETIERRTTQKTDENKMARDGHQDEADDIQNGERPFSQGQSLDKDRERRKRQFDETCERRTIQRSDGNQIARDGHQDVADDIRF